MKKVILFALVGVALCVSGNELKAQGRFSGGLELGLPVGTLGDAANVGFGASARYEAPIQDKLNWTANLGFLSFGAKGSTSTASASYTMVPIQGGVKYYFTESFNGLYASANLGFTVVSAKASIQGFGSFSSSSTNFSFAPGIGYHLENLDFGAAFQIVSDANYLSIRAAYVFGGK